MSELTNEHIDVLNQMHRWKMYFFGIVILLAGAVIGGGAALIALGQKATGFGPGVESIGAHMVLQLQHELDLDEAQREKVDKFVKNCLDALLAIRQTARPQIAQEMDKLDEQVMAVLDEEQQVIWTGNIEHLRERLAGPGGAGPPGPGPGPHDHRFRMWHEPGPPPHELPPHDRPFHEGPPPDGEHDW